MAEKTQQFAVQVEDAGRIDAFVAKVIGFSRSRVRGLIDHGGVRLNGEVCVNPATLVRAGDGLAVVFDAERRYRDKKVVRSTSGFSVLYVDDYLVVVDKHAGILSVPTEREERSTLIDLVSTHLGRGQRGGRKAFIVHRLDRDTSGVLVLGRTPAVAKALMEQFAERKPEREYLALVAGTVVREKDVIRTRLATDKALNQRSKAVETEHGQLAITHYAVTKRYADATRVAVHLETGRRNQIRVHFADMGHPVLGDSRYSAAQATHAAWPSGRLALHALTLGLVHPKTGRPMRFSAEVPAAFIDFDKRSKPLSGKISE